MNIRFPAHFRYADKEAFRHHALEAGKNNPFGGGVETKLAIA